MFSTLKALPEVNVLLLSGKLNGRLTVSFSLFQAQILKDGKKCMPEG
jgi:hypothetical protein